MKSCRRGLTRIEILVILSLILIGISILLPSLHKTRSNQQVFRRGVVVRTHMIALESWASTYSGAYPLPSIVDAGNTTFAETGRAKDTTSNIYSILIWNMLLTPEALAGASAYTNTPWLKVKDDYDYREPAAARDPKHAIADPSFNSDFSAGQDTHSAIAHLQPAGNRLSVWLGQQPRSTLPIISERGPKITGSSTNPDGSISPIYDNPMSRTLNLDPGIPGWTGNVAFGDGHVAYITRPNARTLHSTIPDYFFLDEPSDPLHANDYLGIFRRAGESPADYEAIWD